ncbi:MAG: sulfatase-like hydrolase/transferase, partial [Nitrospira sp.]|nr:sulfatase-like hydrolase/transferase [Nitrospira sp.]
MQPPLMYKSLAFLVLAPFAFMAPAHADAQRPNILWIVSEDNAAQWIKLYDPNGAPMPNLERLASRGLVFDHAFAHAPVCSSSRSTIISGAYG